MARQRKSAERAATQRYSIKRSSVGGSQHAGCGDSCFLVLGHLWAPCPLARVFRAFQKGFSPARVFRTFQRSASASPLFACIFKGCSGALVNRASQRRLPGTTLSIPVSTVPLGNALSTRITGHVLSRIRQARSAHTPLGAAAGAGWLGGSKGLIVRASASDQARRQAAPRQGKSAPGVAFLC